jgi:tetratricopeptide (TPR) repeat protein
MALLAMRSRGAVVDIDQALGPRAILARAQGDRLVVALPAPGPTSTAVLAALRLADRLRAALSVEDPVVHVAEVRLKRRGIRLACAGPALDDLGWADHPSVSAARASLTQAAADELDPTTLATVTASGSPAAAREPTLVGRDATLAAVANDAARGPGLATVLGGAGAGKSRFLAELARELERRGVGPIARVSARDLVIARNMPLAAALAGSGLSPKAILVDDAQVADSAALDAIELASLDHPSAWVCVAALPELVEKRPAWDARALRAARWTLAPLEPADAAALLRQVLDAEFMPDAVVDRLVEAGAGVPLHLVELALGLQQSGALRSRPGTDGVYVAADHLVHISSTPLGDRMAERALAEMPPSSVVFARLCAVLGDDVELVDVEHAQRAAGGDEWVDARVGLARLSAADVLTQVSPTRWRFEHRMLRQGILSGTPAGEREMLHRAALTVEEGRPEPRFDRLAEHARAIGDREAAWTAYSALAIGSAEAGHHIEAELAWTSALGNLPPSDPRREDALVGRARAREKLQAFDESLSDLGSALELALGRGDAAAAANVRLDEATVHDWRLHWDESRAAAISAQSLAEGVGDPVLRARLDLAMGRSAARFDELNSAIPLLSRAADSPHASHETRTISLLLLAGILVWANRNQEATVRFDEALALSRSRDDDFHSAAALINRSLLWFRLDRIDESERDLRLAMELARRLGAAQLERLADINLGEVLYWRWKLPEALALAERALALRSRFSGDSVTDDILLLARIRLGLGDWAGATTARQRAAEFDSPKGKALARIVDLVLAHSDDATWTSAEAEMLSEAPYSEIAIDFYLWAARSALAAGDRARALEWLRRAQARAGQDQAWQGQLSDLALHIGGDSRGSGDH